MFTKRIIPCLDVNAGRVVKGVNFVDLKDAGDPVEIAKAYDKAGADELVFLDITASSDARETVVDMVRKVAEQVFIPFTVGGGIRTVDDFKKILREGADKVAVNEETVRLSSHFDEFYEIISGDEPAGRRLDFLIQEINREINTTGSKANDIEIARYVVELKGETEKLREQVQNIE